MPSFKTFGPVVSEEKIFKDIPSKKAKKNQKGAITLISLNGFSRNLAER